ncbi:MAG: cyclic nucleotide-binding domain-containing protein [Rhodospirillales bacterium]
MADWIETTGYLAAAFGLAAFAMKGMLPLRALAAGMNIAYALYGWLAGVPFLWVAHLVQLLLNLFRFLELLRTRRLAARLLSEDDLSIEPLLPFMLKVKRSRGTRLFEKGEPAEIMYYIAQGRVRIVEIERLVTAGDLIGEIALFAPDRRRTATAVCDTDCVLFALTGKKATELFLEHPAFGLFLIRLITSRLIDTFGAPVPQMGAAERG